MDVIYTADGRNTGFYLQQATKGQWAVHNTNDNVRVRVFKSKNDAEEWVYAKQGKRSLTSQEAAREIMYHARHLLRLWPLVPQSFTGLHLYADVANRLPALVAECKQVIHNGGQSDE